MGEHLHYPGETTVKIHLNPVGRGCSVEIDGKDISNLVRSVRITAATGTRTQVLLELARADVEIEGLSDVAVRPRRRSAAKQRPGLVDTTPVGAEWRTTEAEK